MEMIPPVSTAFYPRGFGHNLKMAVRESGKKKKKRGYSLKVVSFDEEVVPKDIAQDILAKQEDEPQVTNAEHDEKHVTKKKKKNKKSKSTTLQPSTEECNSAENSQEIFPTTTESEVKRKMKKRKIQDEEPPEEIKKQKKSIDSEAPVKAKKEESKRALKKKKYEELIKQKKLKVDLQLQEKSLSYLSKWKHDRNEWKFEKLRQIWLQQNMYDSDKIPDAFWETLIEYFNNSKGKAKNLIIQEAVKIVESEETDGSIKANRARNVIQCLQE